MPTQQHQEIVVRFLEAVNNGDFATIQEVVAPDVVWHGGSFGTMHGLGELQPFFSSVFSAFPDLQITLEDVIEEGDRVAARFTWTATHREAFMGILPTGRRVTVGGINIYRIAGGRIAEEWWSEDVFGLLQQLGAVPSPVPA